MAAGGTETTTVQVGGMGGGGGGRATITQSPSEPTGSPATPSWATGEFYAAMAPLVVAILGAFTGHHLVPGDVEKELAAIGAAVAGAYALARTLLKATHVHAQAKVAAAASMSAAAVARANPAQSINVDAVAAVAARHGAQALDVEALAAALAEQLRKRPARKPTARKSTARRSR